MIKNFAYKTPVAARPDSVKCVSFTRKEASRPAHTFAIVDTFEKKIVDVDGDKVKDLSHGRFIQRLVEAHNAKTIPYKIDDIESDGQGNLDTIISQFQEIARQIRQKEIDIDAVNFSYFCNTPFDQLYMLTDYKVTQENVHKRKIRNDIKAAMQYHADPVFRDFYKIIKAIEEVTAQGVPVYVCGGNHGSSQFNLLSLAKGAIAVGNVDLSGVKRCGTGDNSLVKRWAQGVFNVSPVRNAKSRIIGFDITGTGKPEVPISDVSGGTPAFVRDFYGKTAKSLEPQQSDYNKLYANKYNLTRPEYSPMLKLYSYMPDLFSEKTLFPIDKVAKILNKPPELVENMKQFGDYTNYDFSRVFKTDRNTGKIFNVDDERSGRESINALYGTSYAAPMAMVEDSDKESYGVFKSLNKVFRN